MPGAKRQPEYSIPEEDTALKQHLIARSVDLPPEVLVKVAREIANQPNRSQADADLTNLRLGNRRINDSILDYEDMRESTSALRRHPGVESRHVAICLDVISGIPFKDAFGQNGPLPKADEQLHAKDVEQALRPATPEQLANLADAFSAQTGPAFKEALNGVAWALDGYRPPRLSSANIDNLATLAGAFTSNNLDLEYGSVSTAVEAVERQVVARHHDLLPQANIEQIATLAGAFMGYPDEENTEFAIELLASEVTARGDDLLPQATSKQLATLKATFELEEIRTALAKVARETARRDVPTLSPQNIQGRPQLDNRDRDRSVEL